uniref:Uncharacterized protein n=1 Tax=Lepeophtheirus salmonis TaxID=72036 RepID=A0A0K2T5A8_LEPSM
MIIRAIRTKITRNPTRSISQMAQTYQVSRSRRRSARNISMIGTQPILVIFSDEKLLGTTKNDQLLN